MRLFEGTQFDIPPKCDRCEKLESECKCPPPVAPEVPPEKQLLKLAVEKRKKGKVVTVVRGLAIENNHSKLLTDLKNHCGTGGTLKDNVLEIQGNHIDRVREFLLTAEYRIQGHKKS